MVTIEPFLSEAKTLTRELQQRFQKPSNQKLRDAFVALANGDAAIGLLAFYLWRRQVRRYR